MKVRGESDKQKEDADVSNALHFIPFIYADSSANTEGLEALF